MCYYFLELIILSNKLALRKQRNTYVYIYFIVVYFF